MRREGMEHARPSESLEQKTLEQKKTKETKRTVKVRFAATSLGAGSQHWVGMRRARAAACKGSERGAPRAKINGKSSVFR
jgi:hypothetical protein